MKCPFGASILDILLVDDVHLCLCENWHSWRWKGPSWSWKRWSLMKSSWPIIKYGWLQSCRNRSTRWHGVDWIKHQSCQEEHLTIRRKCKFFAHIVFWCNCEHSAFCHVYVFQALRFTCVLGIYFFKLKFLK